MKIYSKTIKLPSAYLSLSIIQELLSHEQHIPIRLAITDQINHDFILEIDFIDPENYPLQRFSSISDFKKRTYENTDTFNVALIIPTGIGAEIGGHCGDANPIARLIGASCDTLVTHPNVVNASDINEMPSNTLYVEGSTLTRLLMGQIGLQKVRSNKLLLIKDNHQNAYLNNEVINAVSSARVTLGIDCDVFSMDPIIHSALTYTNTGRAAGTVTFLERLFTVVNNFSEKYDAIGLSSSIASPPSCYLNYMTSRQDDVNPYGGIEAMLTHSLSLKFNKPFAHSPLEENNFDFGIVDPRKAPETASITYLHCILKGLAKSPKIMDYHHGFNVENISCLIQPLNCIGMATFAAVAQNIPIIAVKNKTCMPNVDVSTAIKNANIIVVENYLEAVGVMSAIKSGVSLNSIKRPIADTVYLHADAACLQEQTN